MYTGVYVRRSLHDKQKLHVQANSTVRSGKHECHTVNSQPAYKHLTFYCSEEPAKSQTKGQCNDFMWNGGGFELDANKEK